MCGGTEWVMRKDKEGYGLSPRVRGNHYRLSHCRRRPGSIPACAGEPKLATRSIWGLKVYPRVCGGTVKDTATMYQTKGLSPRVRGNRLADFQ